MKVTKKKKKEKVVLNDTVRQHLARANAIRRSLVNLTGTLHRFLDDDASAESMNETLVEWCNAFPRRARKRLKNILAIESKDIVIIDRVEKHV